MPLKQEQSRKLPIRKILSGLMFLSLVVVIVLGMRKPAPISVPQGPERKAVNAESFQQKIDTLAQAQAEGAAGTEVHLTAEEIRAAFSVATGSSAEPRTASTSTSEAVPPSLNAPISGGQPQISEPQVTFEGDLMKGQFTTEIGGKKVYVTINGRLGSKDGYATFEPTEFKIGDLNIPVSLVNDQLQKKMLEERDKLKLPDYIGDLKVENSELVIKPK
jgi:hypothetical protein